MFIWHGGSEYVLAWTALPSHGLDAASALLRQFKGDADAIAAFRRFLVERSDFAEAHRHSDDEVLDALAHLLAGGSAVMGVETRVGSGAFQAAEEASGAHRPQPKPPAPEPLGPPREVKTWVEFEVVDEANNPVSGKHFKVMLPDGKIHEGALDQTGKLRFSNIDPGTCVFSLTDVDADCWRKA